MKTSELPSKQLCVAQKKTENYRHVPIRSHLLDDGKEAMMSLITVAPEIPAISVIHPPGKPSSLIANLPRMPVMAFDNACLGVLING